MSALLIELVAAVSVICLILSPSVDVWCLICPVVATITAGCKKKITIATDASPTLENHSQKAFYFKYYYV